MFGIASLALTSTNIYREPTTYQVLSWYVRLHMYVTLRATCNIGVKTKNMCKNQTEFKSQPQSAT